MLKVCQHFGLCPLKTRTASRAAFFENCPYVRYRLLDFDIHVLGLSPDTGRQKEVLISPGEGQHVVAATAHFIDTFLLAVITSPVQPYVASQRIAVIYVGSY